MRLIRCDRRRGYTCTPDGVSVHYVVRRLFIGRLCFGIHDGPRYVYTDGTERWWMGWVNFERHLTGSIEFRVLWFAVGWWSGTKSQ